MGEGEPVKHDNRFGWMVLALALVIFMAALFAHAIGQQAGIYQ